jgi:excinuclease ABC subunit A
LSSPPIELRGVRVHNLKNVDVDIPRHKLIAVCGVSGSGKTSLAIDTLYAESQRRYIESFSAYTRQFLAKLDKPDYDQIAGLPPAVAVTRGEISRSNRSTVGTATETLDYLRLLYSKIAQLFCRGCQQPIVTQSPQKISDYLVQESQQHSEEKPSRLMLAFKTHWEDRAELNYRLAQLQQDGLVRLAVHERIVNIGRDERGDLAELFPDAGFAWVIVDRFNLPIAPSARLLDSLEIAFREGDGDIYLLRSQSVVEHGERVTLDGIEYQVEPFSNRLRCQRCNIDYLEPSATLFSFNSPLGACPKCEGFGDQVDLDMRLIVPDESLSLREGAIAPWNSPAYQHELEELLSLAADYGISVTKPYKELSAKQKKLIFDGVPERNFGGLRGFFAWLERKKYKMHIRVLLSRYRSYSTCSECQGKRLNPTALSYRLLDMNFAEFCALEVRQSLKRLQDMQLTDRELALVKNVLSQVRNRLAYLNQVGLGYLTLDRTLRTLSGGEGQRVALTTALGSSLVNMLYVLDEPTVGLHPADTAQLIAAIHGLRDRGNTVVVVEHEDELLREADWMIEVGPAAGTEGGKITFQGTVKAAERPNASLTGEYLSGRRGVSVAAQRRQPKGWYKLRGCTQNNLKNIDVDIPLGVLCVVTGVSGSGKSSLVLDTLYSALSQANEKNNSNPRNYQQLYGVTSQTDVVLIDHTPLSRSPRSNPLTAIGAFDELRTVYAKLPYSVVHGLSKGHFSFNMEKGRCDHCEGNGQLSIDMQFLADVTMRCPECDGTRYKKEILQALYRDRNIAEVLEMPVTEAIEFMRGHTALTDKLSLLRNVGLGHVRIGQPVSTLSAGENQRLKLASHLHVSNAKKTLFIMDEPTTGLHYKDVVQLLDCTDELLNNQQSVIIIEHNMQMILSADYIIDLGPGAAGEGGEVIATGTPEEVAKNPRSITAKYLSQALKEARSRR